MRNNQLLPSRSREFSFSSFPSPVTLGNLVTRTCKCTCRKKKFANKHMVYSTARMATTNFPAAVTWDNCRELSSRLFKYKLHRTIIIIINMIVRRYYRDRMRRREFSYVFFRLERKVLWSILNPSVTFSLARNVTCAQQRE